MTAPTPDRPDLTRDQFTNDESYYLATGRRFTRTLTPGQLRALADKRKAEAAAGRSDLFDPIDGWAIEAEAALRTAADQLEAVQALLTEAHDKFAANYDAERMIGRGPSSIGVAGAPLASSVQRALDLLRAKATENIERLNADTAPQEDRDWPPADDGSELTWRERNDD